MIPRFSLSTHRTFVKLEASSPGGVGESAHASREPVPRSVWVLPESALGRERYLAAVGCCAQLRIDVKHRYDSYFLLSAFGIPGAVVGFRIFILQMMKLILRNMKQVAQGHMVSRRLSWDTIPRSPDSEVLTLPTPPPFQTCFSLRFLIPFSQRDRFSPFRIFADP